MPAKSIDRRLGLWIGSLAALAALNAGLWVWIARSASRTAYVETQLLLSAVYVGVCAFRSLVPRIDVERICLWDTWLSVILLGRTLATIAELCFALQCGLFVQRQAAIAGTPLLIVGPRVCVGLVIVAEMMCWYAVLTLNHVGHAIEELLWALLMLVVATGLGTIALGAHGPLRLVLLATLLLYGIGVVSTVAIDVRMYIRRWREGTAAGYLTLAAGLRDSRHRRHPTMSWDDWREEVPWMTVYFSVGVWTSLAMVLLN
jgi:hypothetical protein